MPKYDFNKVAKQLRHGCFIANLLHIFRTPFSKNTSEWLLPSFLSESSFNGKIFDYQRKSVLSNFAEAASQNSN